MPAKNHSEPVNSQTDIAEDEIELMDFLRVIWEHKLLIVIGTLACILMGAIISFSLPKFFQVEMIIKPGVITEKMNQRIIYADEPENIKTFIQKNVKKSEIQKVMDASGKKYSDPLKYSVKIPRRSSLLVITHETANPAQGVKLLSVLFDVITDYYSDRKNTYKDNYENEIRMLKEGLIGNESSQSHTKETVDTLFQLEHQISKELNLLNERKNHFKGDLSYLQLKSNYNNQMIEITRERAVAQETLIKLKEQQRVITEKIQYLESRMDKIQMIELVKPPSATNHPIKPNVKLNMMMATAAGFFVMLLVSFFLEYIKNYQKRNPKKID
jgi:capsular polysaccharide biosynthesis protein